MFRCVRSIVALIVLPGALAVITFQPAFAQGGRREPSTPAPPSQKDPKAVPRPADQKAEPRPADEKAEPRPSDKKGPASGRPPVGHSARGQFVFVGGYFYDPYFGPYPWWHRPAYPYPYFPVYDARAQVRLVVKPSDAAVYVDGFYAGVVDDFDNLFQRLPLAPGGHEISLFLEGYRTTRHRLYLGPGTSLTLRDTMERLPAGLRSELPPLAAPVPAPPPGTYAPPRTPATDQPPAPSPLFPPRVEAVGYGSLILAVQPIDADVIIDGQRWISSAQGRFVVQVSAGAHRLEIIKAGYRSFTAEIQVREAEENPVNVSLSPERR